LAAIFLVSLLGRLPLLLHPPAAFFYSPDELDLTFAAVDRFLGLPSTVLMEPSSFLQFLFLPVFLADMVIRGGLPLSSASLLSQLSSQLSQAYADPHHVVLMMRALVALLSCAGPVLAYCITETLSESKWAGVLSAAFVSFKPVFLQRSVMAASDAVGITLVLASVLCLLKMEGGGKFHYAGFLLAAGMASKITVASFASVLFVLLLIDDRIATWSERTKSLVRFCMGLIFGFLFWCPYVWTDPIRMAKAVYGTINRPGSYFDLKAFTEGWWQGMGAGFSIVWLVLFVAGCWVVFRYRRPIGLAAAAGSVLICAPLALRATITSPWYFLPLLPCMVLLLGVVAGENNRLFSSRSGIRNSMYVFLTIMATLMAAESVGREREVREPDELTEAVKAIQSMPRGTVLYVPQELFTHARIRLPRGACERVRERLRGKLLDMTGVIQFMENRGMPRKAAEVLVTSFNEDEQAAAAHMAIACRSAPGDLLSVYLYYTPQDFAIERSLADMGLESALERARTSKNSAILVEGLHIPWGAAFWSGKGDWYWYRSQEGHP
jgi:hypothetical protein